MKALLLGYLVALSFAHMAVLGPVRYAIIGPILLLVIAASRRVYLPRSRSYRLGAALFVLGGLVPTLLYGGAQSLTYIPFIALNVCLLPYFGKLEFSTTHIGVLAGYFFLTLCLIPGTPGAQFVYGNENNYATVSLCGMYFALLATRRSWVLQAAAAVPFVFFAFVSQSRTQLAASLLFVAVYFAQRLLRVQLRYAAVALLLLMGFAYVTLMLGDPYGIIEIVQENTMGHKSYRGLSYRDVLLFNSLELLGDYPLGVGWGRSGIALEAYTGETLSPHNMFMKVAVEAGWVALAGYLLMLFGFLLRSPTKLSVAFLLAVSLRGLFESATPFTLSLISAMHVLPFFLNEHNVAPGRFSLLDRFVLSHPGAATHRGA